MQRMVDPTINRGATRVVQRKIGPSLGTSVSYAKEKRAVYDANGMRIGVITYVYEDGTYRVERGDEEGALRIRFDDDRYFLEPPHRPEQDQDQVQEQRQEQVEQERVPDEAETKPVKQKPKKKTAANPPKDPLSDFIRLMGPLADIREALARTAGTSSKADCERMGVLLDRLGSSEHADTRLKDCNESTRLWVRLREHDPKRSGKGASSSAEAKQMPKDDSQKMSMDLGREAYQNPYRPKPSTSGSAKGKKDPAVSDKGAGDHVFNDPFSIVADALKGESNPLVAEARDRLLQIAKTWASELRDNLRAYFVQQREGITDANSIAFGMFGEQLRHLLKKAYTAKEFRQVYTLISRMFRNGMVDPSAYKEVQEKEKEKKTKLLAEAEQFLETHLHDVEQAVDALREVRIGGRLFSEIRLIANRCIKKLRNGGTGVMAEEDIKKLQQLKHEVGEKTFGEQIDGLKSDPLQKVKASELDKLMSSIAASAALSDEPIIESTKEESETLPKASSPKKKKGEEARGGQGTRRASPLRAGSLNLLHNYNHYHLLLQTPGGGILDLNVPGDGNCFAHAVAWGELLSGEWATYIGDAANLPLEEDNVREMMGERIRALEEAEGDATRQLRVDIAGELEQAGDYTADIYFALADYINTARYLNDQELDASDWHFEGAGVLLSSVLQEFVSDHLEAVLDEGQDLVSLVATEPLLKQVYIESVRTDERMWLGNAEERALNAVRACNQATPIHVVLPRAMPRADMYMDVDDALHEPSVDGESGSGPVVGGSQQLFNVPQWTYRNLTKDTRGFLLEDLTNFFIEQGWAHDANGSAHVMNCRDVPEPLELHASLTQKDPVKSPRVNQVEFVMRMKQREDGGKDRGSSVRWWYWLNVDAEQNTVRLQFDGNVGGDASKLVGEKLEEQKKRQAQSDENETAYYRYLMDSGFDAAAEMTRMVRQLEAYLTREIAKRPKSEPVVPKAKEKAKAKKK
ncbi:hypothetical protein [Paenibacillus agaridevorans]|uniref:hypothetical protein n=1 Tax=Paenibacillus agaridevorans TaxID=171404 RepID=UPI001FE51600|nr:hypothetical protein [Paenibacillus agaridevorans]